MDVPTPASPGVDIEPRTMKWLGSVYPGCFLSLVPDGRFDASALGAAVDRVLQRAADWHHGDPPVQPTTVIEGVDALHIRIQYGAAEKSEVRAWASQLAAALTDAGISGTLARPLPQYPPQAVTRAANNDRVVSVMYAMRGPIDADVATRLASVHGLGLFERHTLSGGSEFTIEVPDSSGLAASLPDLGRSATLEGWDEARVASAHLMCGTVVAQGHLCFENRQTQVARARAALVHLAGDVHHAFAEVMTGLHGWTSTPHDGPDGLSSGMYSQLRDVWPAQVFDSHGLQILTRDHLDRATDLTDWRVEEVGDRYLVEATDLDPWFAGDGVDAEVLAKARADFGDMIFTEAERRARHRGEL